MSQSQNPLLIAIDDQKFYLDEIAYELRGRDVDYRPFEGPSSFEELVATIDVNRAKLILVDYDFQTCTVMDCDLVGYIKEKYPDFTGKIVLLSLLDDFLSDNEAVNRNFDGIINKSDLTWDRIRQYLN